MLSTFASLRSTLLSALLLVLFLPIIHSKFPVAPPISTSLIGHYNADSWTGMRWADTSGSGNHVVEIGGSSIAVVQPTGAPKHISGSAAAWMVFPEAILPSSQYTLFFVARFNGATKQRIFQGFNTDWFSGFGGGQSGIAFHANCEWIGGQSDLHNTDWVIGSDRSNTFRSNGIDRTTRTSKNDMCSSFDRLAINTGRRPNDGSDFAIQSLLVYDARLSDAEVQVVESWLMSQQPPFSPANLQGIVGFYDARDLTVCIASCSWFSRAGSLGPLVGVARTSSDGWVMNPAFATNISGLSAAYTSIVAFKMFGSSTGNNRLRTLLNLGNSCRSQSVTDYSLQLSDCTDPPADVNSSALQHSESPHVWAVVHDGNASIITYLNGMWMWHQRKTDQPLCREVVIGNNGSPFPSKFVSLSNYDCPAIVNRGNWLGSDQVSDNFEIKRISKSIIEAKRIDQSLGWGMNLRVRCCINQLSNNQLYVGTNQKFTRFVRIQSIRSVSLAVSYVAVFSSNGSMISEGRSVSTSCGSLCSAVPPSVIVNGRPATRNSSFWVSNAQPSWIEIDLGQSHIVSKVVFYNRQNCCQESANQAFLMLLDGSRRTVDAAIMTADLIQNFHFETSDFGLKFVLLMNRTLSNGEVAAVSRWSFQTHGVGTDLMNFSPSTWTEVSDGQVYWKPAVHMQPLSNTMLRFLINITSPHEKCREILRLGPDYTMPQNTTLNRAITIGISAQRAMNLDFAVSQSAFDSKTFVCPNQLLGPSLVTVVFTRAGISVIINSVRRCNFSVTVPAFSASDHAHRSTGSGNCSGQGGFVMRSLQLQDFDVSDLDAQIPAIINVTPQVLNASHPSSTVIGSPFVAGATCSALYLDGTVSNSCVAVSSVEIVATRSFVSSDSWTSMLVAVMHNGTTFRAPVTCIDPFFYIDHSGLCMPSSVSFNISPGDRVSAKTNATLILKLVAAGSILYNTSVTLTYPSHFFVPNVNPDATAGTTGSDNYTISCGETGSSVLVLFTNGTSSLASATSLTVTIRGLTMGAATIGGVVTVTLQQFPTTRVFAPVSSGAIFEASGTGGKVALSRYLSDKASTAAISFTVVGTSFWTVPEGITSVELLVVAGGGSGGGSRGGGGGGGGIVYIDRYDVTPGRSYIVTVGSGGGPSAVYTSGNNGGNSSFDSITAIGGGGGGSIGSSVGFAGKNGGSGGGACLDGALFGSYGNRFPGQGNSGGGCSFAGCMQGGGGGGGAGETGTKSGNGGSGLGFEITGQLKFYGGGGGGAQRVCSSDFGGLGGTGGGGNGLCDNWYMKRGAAGLSGSGGGGGGGWHYESSILTGGGAGGSGIVIIRPIRYAHAIISFFAAASISSAFNFISVSGLRFLSLQMSDSQNICRNLNPSNLSIAADYRASSGVLLLNLSSEATPESINSEIACNFTGATAAGAATSNVSLATFSKDGLPLQIQDGVEFPAVFPALGLRANIILSSYIAFAANVTVTVSFTASSFSSKLSVVSVTGLLFDDIAQSQNNSSRTFCYSNLSPRVNASVTFSASAGLLLFKLSNDVKDAVITLFGPGEASVPSNLIAVGRPQFPSSVIWRAHNTVSFNNPGKVNEMSSNYYKLRWKLGQELTVSAWILSDESYPMAALSLRNDFDASLCFDLNIRYSMIDFTFVSQNGGISWNSGFSHYKPNPNTFFHVAFSRASNSRTKIYVNSELVRDTTTGSWPLCDTFYIGTASSRFPKGFHGYMQDLFISNRVLSDQEIRSLSALVPLNPTFACIASGLVNPASSEASKSVTLSLFDDEGSPMQRFENVHFPAIFPAIGAGGRIALSSHIAALDDAVLKLNWPDSSMWINPVSSRPRHDAVDNSWVWDYNKVFESGPISLNLQSKGFTLTSRFMVREISTGSYERYLFDLYASDTGRRISLSFIERYRYLRLILWSKHFTINFEFESEFWYTLTVSYDAITKSLKVYANRDVIHNTVETWSLTPTRFSNCYIGKDGGGYHFTGRIAFLALYDRALNESEILHQHTNRISAQNNNVTLTLLFLLRGSTAFKTLSVSGLHFSAISTNSTASCTNMQNSEAAISVIFETSPAPSLVLLLSAASAATSESLPIICKISQLTNSERSRESELVSISAFDAGGNPLQTQNDVVSPTIIYPRQISAVPRTLLPSTGETILQLYGANAGLSDSSGKARVGSTSCHSTIWLNDHLVTCRSANGAGFGIAVVASVWLNTGALWNAISHIGASLNFSVPDFALPLTGARLVSSFGLHFGSFDSSASAKFGHTSCELSLWKSSTTLTSKTSGRFNRRESVAHTVTVSRSRTLFGPAIPLLWFENVSFAHRNTMFNSASTGGALAVIVGINLGSSIFTARTRFKGSASQFTLWSSDSSTALRISCGTVQSNSSLFVTMPGFNATTFGSVSAALSYNTPSLSIVSSRYLSNISIVGSDFGPYLSVIPRTKTCMNTTLVTKHSSSFVCNSTELVINDASVTVTEANIGITFADVLRLDDVVVSLWSPQSREYVLMRNKCYGALRCGPSSSVTFNFQILPAVIAPVPLDLCSSSGTYSIEAADAESLRSILLSSSAIGTWSLRVSSGSQNQKVTSSFIYFKTATLEFYIGNQSTTSLTWFSDSSVMMKAPGYQIDQGIDSSSGFGLNNIVAAESSGFSSPSTCRYSYPDPILTAKLGGPSYISSGSHVVQIVGRYLSNVDSRPRSRMGRSACTSTRWLSDTALSCFQPPALGIFHAIVLTLGNSALAKFNASSALFPAQSVISTLTLGSIVAITAASTLTILGSGFGRWDSSMRSRMSSLSAADSTTWLCDTHVATKTLPFAASRNLQTVVSLSSIASNIFVVPVLNRSVAVSACGHISQESLKTPMIVASTGANSVILAGFGFGNLADRSSSVKFSQTLSQLSAWSSDSIITSKSPWGFRALNPPVIVSVDQFQGLGANVFNFHNADVRNLTILNASVTVMHLDGSAMSLFPLPAVVKIDNRVVSSNWTSDSSVFCEHPWPVSRDGFSFFVRFFDQLSPESLLSLSTPANPIFVASSKTVSESLNVVMYIPAPNDVLENAGEFIQSGPGIGWMFPPQYTFSRPSFFDSQVFDIDLVIFNNHTQVYLKDYVPITIVIEGSVSVINSAGESVPAFVCHGNLSISTAILPNTFAVLFRTHISICLPKDSETSASHTLSIVSRILVRDELGSFLSYSTEPVDVMILPHPSVGMSHNAVNTTFFAGAVQTVPFTVSLNNTGAKCSELVFNYRAEVVCNTTNQTFIPVPFYTKGFCDNSAATTVVENKLLRTCDIILQTWTFGAAGSCKAVISTPNFGASILVPIVILPGEPVNAMIVGELSRNVSPGGIIWSSNASGMKCLEVSFTDKCNNTRDAGGFSCQITAFLSNLSQAYSLLGETRIESGPRGRCVFCSARVSEYVHVLVQLQLHFVQSTVNLYPALNISGLSEAAVVSLISPTSSNLSKAGSALPSLTFKLFDANGLLVGKPGTVIRLRIVRNRSGSIRSRNLLEALSPSSNSCNDAEELLFAASNSSTGEITVSGTSICGIGDHVAVYDIGSLDSNGDFSPSVLSVFSQLVTIVHGPPSCFQFVSTSNLLERTLAMIQSGIVVQLMDAGRNYVNGSLEYSLMSPNFTTVSVVAPTTVAVDFNSNLAYESTVPPFFVLVSAWSIQKSRIVLIGASSKVFDYVGQYVQLNVSATCSSGFYVNISKELVENLTFLYHFLIHLNPNSNLCVKCVKGTFSTPDTVVQCTNCSAGTFSNSNNTACVRCPSGTWSKDGMHEKCLPCDGGVTTREQDCCATLKFLYPPQLSMISDVSNQLSTIALMDVYESSVVKRSGSIFAQLQCRRPGCQTELNADFDLLTVPLEIANGSTTKEAVTFSERSPIKVGTGFTWRLFTAQNPGNLVSSIIDAQETSYSVAFVGVPPSLRSVEPTEIASVGGTVLSISSTWKLIPGILKAFPNGTALCVFSFIGNYDNVHASNFNISSFREERVQAIDTSDETVKICATPAVPEFSFANVSIILQDGRRSSESFLLLSVCHNNFYINASKCSSCPVSSKGESTNSAINAPSIEHCLCAAASYGTFGQFCRFCPKPSSLSQKPPFICNSTNLRWPVVAPGYWVEYSLLARCEPTSVNCIAVTTCPFGPRACPGGGEKICTQNDAECYEGRGCGACCASYYNENNACFKCPDSNETTALIAVVAVFCFILAVLMSSVSSPSFTQSIKYFVISSAFLQKMFSLKLIKVDWPLSVASMFDWLRFFSFSINVVRPECAFSWKFQTKVIITLLTPVGLSVLTLLSGFLYGMIASYKLWKILARERRESNKYSKISYLSVLSCWAHVVLFRDVKFSDDRIMWFVLYPALSERIVKRSNRDSSENWSILKEKFKNRSMSRLNLFKSREERVREALGNTMTLDVMQKSARQDQIDVRFSSIVRSGRRFASGVFSILVFTFVGTLNSALSVWVCEERDGTEYLSQDANVECNLNVPEYRQLFSVATFGLALYGIVLPLSIFLVLRSNWCKQMMTYDLSGFDALFGFVTSRYSMKCYMWEVVIFFHKTSCVVIPTFNANSSVQQSILMLFVSLVYLLLILKYSPFANSRMNFIETLCNINLFLMYFCALMFIAEVDGELVVQGQLKYTVGVCLCVLSIFSVIATLFCAWLEWIEILMLHNSLFASKWMQALHFSLGDSFTSDKALALLYVMYNPVSRRDITKKKLLANKLLAEAMQPLHARYLNKPKSLAFYVKASWAMFKFAFSNRELADCNPTLVMEASQELHAALFKNVSRMMMLIRHQQRDAKADWKTAKTKILGRLRLANAFGATKFQSSIRSPTDIATPEIKATASSFSWMAKLKNCWQKTNRIVPSRSDREQFSSDAPKMFVDQFSWKRQFVAENIEDEARLSILTLFMFQQEDDFGSSSECVRHKRMFDTNIAAFQKCLRALFRISKELGCMDSKKKIAELPRADRIFQQLLDLIFGEELNLLRNFHWLKNEEAFDMFQRHEFPELQEGDCQAPSVSEVLKHLMVANFEENNQEKVGSPQISKEDVHSDAKSSSPASNLSVSQKPHSDGINNQAQSPLQPSPGARVRPVIFSSKATRLVADSASNSVTRGVDMCAKILSSGLTKDVAKVHQTHDAECTSLPTLDGVPGIESPPPTLAVASATIQTLGATGSSSDIDVSECCEDQVGEVLRSSSTRKLPQPPASEEPEREGYMFRDGPNVSAEQLSSQVQQLSSKLAAAEEQIRVLQTALKSAFHNFEDRGDGKQSLPDIAALSIDLRIANASIVAAFLRADAAEERAHAAEARVKELQAVFSSQKISQTTDL